LEQGADADSGTWKQYWITRKALRTLVTAQHASDAAIAPQSFSLPVLVDGPWNRSSHVSHILANGFSMSPDITKRGKMPAGLKFANSYEQDYIGAMVRDGVLEKGEISMFNRHFFLYKPGKLRLIFHGKRLNSCVKPPPHFNMKSHPTLGRLSAKYAWYAGFDLSHMFLSVPLAQDFRKFFGIRTPFGDFRYTCLPFGFNWSPFIAHIIIDQVIQRAIEEGIPCSHFLDDGHVYGDTKEEVLRNFNRLLELLTEAGWQINPKKTVKPCQKYQALGVVYDLVEKTSAIPTAMTAKLLAQHSRMKGLMVTKRQVASVAGTFVFYNNAYPGFLSHLSPLLAFLKALPCWETRINYVSVAPIIGRLLDLALGMRPIALQVHSNAPEHAFCDATNTQVGFVTPEVTAACAIPFTQIYRAEALGAQLLLQQPLDKDVCLRIDNQALMFAIRKGRSNIPEANTACKQVFALRRLGSVITTKYIRSEDNPADWPFRCSLV
jgi:hypothetical protein